MTIPKGKKDREPKSQFSDPSRQKGGVAEDSMEASLQEMERARESHPQASETEPDKHSKKGTVGQGGGDRQGAPPLSQDRK